MVVTTAPGVRVETMASPWALVVVTTAPGVREGLLPAAAVVEPELMAPVDPAAVVELSPGPEGEVLVAVVVNRELGEEPAAGVVVVPVEGLPSGDVAVTIGGDGVTGIVDDSPTTGLVLTDCPGGDDVVVVPLLGTWRLARATILLAREASSRWRTSAAVRSFSNMP